ncbi:MAG: DUF2752 domain-containing protein [Acidobacteriota bacterium]
MGPVKKAFLLAWLAASAASLFVLIAPVALPAATLLRVAPACERKARYGEECALCGMTRAFAHIGRGELREAAAVHRAGLPLYLGLLANVALAGWTVARRIIRDEDASHHTVSTGGGGLPGGGQETARGTGRERAG